MTRPARTGSDRPDSVRGFFRSRLRSFTHAGRGLSFILRTQHNAWIHLMVAAGIVVIGVLVGLERSDWLWVASAIALVWFAEAMNTAFEILSDVVQPEKSIRIKVAKDIAAAAVLICSVYAVVVGVLVFSTHLF